jgi:uncharacterized protein YpmB
MPLEIWIAILGGLFVAIFSSTSSGRKKPEKLDEERDEEQRD